MRPRRRRAGIADGRPGDADRDTIASPAPRARSPFPAPFGGDDDAESTPDARESAHRPRGALHSPCPGGPGGRDDHPRGRRALRPGDRRDAARSRSRGLADGPSHLRLPGLQPAGPDQPGQRAHAAGGLDARDGRGPAAGAAARLRRGDVPRQQRRPHPGARCDDRGSALGLPAPRPRRPAGVRHARQPDPQHRHLRQPHLSPDGRRAPAGPRCPHRRGGLGHRDGRLPGRHHALVGRDDHRRPGAGGPHLQPPEPRRPLLHLRPRLGRRDRAVAGLHRGGRR